MASRGPHECQWIIHGRCNLVAGRSTNLHRVSGDCSCRDLLRDSLLLSHQSHAHGHGHLRCPRWHNRCDHWHARYDLDCHGRIRARTYNRRCRLSHDRQSLGWSLIDHPCRDQRHRVVHPCGNSRMASRSPDYRRRHLHATDDLLACGGPNNRCGIIHPTNLHRVSARRPHSHCDANRNQWHRCVHAFWDQFRARVHRELRDHPGGDIRREFIRP